jgi:hypothetical protein
MQCCGRPREDPGNLKTVCEFSESKDMAFIAVGGSDHRKVARMDTFRTPYRMGFALSVTEHTVSQRILMKDV